LTALGVVVGIGLWLAGQRVLTCGWVAALGGNALLNPMLKQVFSRARPLHPDLVSPAQGFSFPSGHSSGAMVAYGMLAYLAWRLLPPRCRVPAAMLAAAVIVTTASSRVFLQVHFASDVLAGLCSGLGWLALCVGSLEFARHRAARRFG
jgi:undecaprenyl-diphosphatase